MLVYYIAELYYNFKKLVQKITYMNKENKNFVIKFKAQHDILSINHLSCKAGKSCWSMDITYPLGLSFFLSVMKNSLEIA